MTLTRRQLLTGRLRPPAPKPPPRPELLPSYLRPPGALDEKSFLETCQRCGACREACPYDVVLPLGPAYGRAAGTPALLPRDGPCRLCPDLPCARACPSGALSVVPIAEVRMGTARLQEGRCWAVQGQPCDYCVRECPLGADVLAMEDGRPRIREEACTGCGLCVHICTATPAALEIVPWKPASGESP